MPIAPFGTLNELHKSQMKGLYTPMPAWPASEAAKYKSLLKGWLGDIENAIWPAWQAGAWHGKAVANMETATRAELALIVQLYQGGGNPDVLEDAPDLPSAPDNVRRTHNWHYRVEDAGWDHPFYSRLELPSSVMTFEFLVRKDGSANYQLYEPGADMAEFKRVFLIDSGTIVPPLYDIKKHFQRPRPWSAAAGLGVDDYRWITAHWNTHTGVHPSLLSGHCIQGILGGCNVLDRMLDGGGTADQARIRAIQQYMVDWGDRRVFAGVHYMTDNIASWTLARRLIPHLFKNPQQVEKLAVEAITRHSRVFADIVQHFDPASPARTMLIDYFPEALVAS